MDPEAARHDFQERLQQYESIYETLDEEKDKEISYIKLYNVGQYLKANHCNGVLESEIIFYLLNAHIQPRKIWLCIHGETDYDVKGILGGDPDLNDNGIRFSRELHDFISSQGEVRMKRCYYIERACFHSLWYFSSCIPDRETTAIWV